MRNSHNPAERRARGSLGSVTVLGFLLLGLLYTRVLVLFVHRSRRTEAVLGMRNLQPKGTCAMGVLAQQRVHGHVK